MRLRLDPSSRIPVGEQLRRRLEGLILSGSLGAGERVPTVRSLARSQHVAPGTVAKAYRSLESEGLLIGRGRLGTFVAEELPDRPTEAEELLGRAAQAYARRARQLGFDPSQALRRVRAELAGR
jgi:DNA-binding transcriptional regulator YhcF (GntR family)